MNGAYFNKLAHRCRAALSRLARDRRGNVLMLFGLSLVPIMLATGAGVDYSHAARLRTKLNAIADAAALSAVTQPMMNQSDTVAKARVIAMFNSQAAELPGLIYDASQLQVTVAPNDGILTSREVALTYTAKAKNAFSGIIGVSTITIGGAASSSSSVAPNIDFYLLMDSSPSMALPSTSAGLNSIRTMTGCAFACHLSLPHSEGIYVKDNATFAINKTMSVYNSITKTTKINADGTYVDASLDVHNADGSYVDSVWLAKNKGIPLRIDAERTAVKSLMDRAKQLATQTGTTYRAALFHFNYGPNFQKLFPSGTDVVTSDLTALGAQAANIPLLKMHINGCITPSFCNDDMETDYYTALSKMSNSTIVPNPGNGSNQSGDKPQGIIFIVTDGMSDENLGGRTHREMQAAHIAQCTALKARGLRIAILYTVYLPESLTGNSWSQANVAPHLPKVAPALTACASPGLMYSVTTDEDISAKLEALFRKAISTAHLTN